MTKAQQTYIDTLNLLGSDVLDPQLQKIVDHEHELADPAFRKILKKRSRLAHKNHFCTSPYLCVRG